VLGQEHGAATVESSLEVPEKVRHRTTCKMTSNASHRCIHKRNENMVFHSSIFITAKKKMEKLISPFTVEQREKTCCIHTMEYCLTIRSEY